jgi:hypothetical protein
MNPHFGTSSNHFCSRSQVCTRLPAFEDDFQNERPVMGSFLSEAITEQPRYLSPFNEAIIFATLCGRRLFYRQQHHVRSAYGDMSSNWTDSALMLDDILTQRLRILSQCYSSPNEASGQMIHFMNTMAQISVIYCSTSADMLLRVDEGNPMQEEYELRATAAVDQIIKLAQVLTKSFVFKVSPLKTALFSSVIARCPFLIATSSDTSTCRDTAHVVRRIPLQESVRRRKILVAARKAFESL